MGKHEEGILKDTHDITKDEVVLFMTSERESILYNNDESFMERIRQIKGEDFNNDMQISDKHKKFASSLLKDITFALIVVNNSKRWGITIKMYGGHSFFVYVHQLKEVAFVVVSAIGMKINTNATIMNEFVINIIKTLKEDKLP